MFSSAKSPRVLSKGGQRKPRLAAGLHGVPPQLRGRSHQPLRRFAGDPIPISPTSSRAARTGQLASDRNESVASSLMAVETRTVYEDEGAMRLERWFKAHCPAPPCVSSVGGFARLPSGRLKTPLC